MKALIAILMLAACGGGDDGGNPPADSASGTDAKVSNIEVVTPCVGESATVTADPSESASTYMPASTTISVGQIVKFEMPLAHNVAPNTSSEDPGLSVGFGATKCLKFTAAGTYKFKCTPHGFVGTIVVN
jgi:plastocyanin